MKIGDAKIECPACHETIRVPLMVTSAKTLPITLTADKAPIREHILSHQA